MKKLFCLLLALVTAPTLAQAPAAPASIAGTWQGRLEAAPGTALTIQFIIKEAPGGGYDLGRLRALQDWYIRYQLASVQGVAEVASIGGFVKQYQIELSATKMRAVNVTVGEVMAAVQNANLNVGGKTKRFGQRFGKRQDYKKAYVRLAPGQSIELTGAEA